MVLVPPATPDTKPVDELIVTTPVFDDDQTPPAGELRNVAVSLAQRNDGPDGMDGEACTVCVRVVKQPE